METYRGSLINRSNLYSRNLFKKKTVFTFDYFPGRVETLNDALVIFGKFKINKLFPIAKLRNFFII